MHNEIFFSLLLYVVMKSQFDLKFLITYLGKLSLQIGGIGKVTEHILRDVFGINTCEDMLQKGGFLCALFSHSTSG